MLLGHWDQGQEPAPSTTTNRFSPLVSTQPRWHEGGTVAQRSGYRLGGHAAWQRCWEVERCRQTGPRAGSSPGSRVWFGEIQKKERCGVYVDCLPGCRQLEFWLSSAWNLCGCQIQLKSGLICIFWYQVKNVKFGRRDRCVGFFCWCTTSGLTGMKVLSVWVCETPTYEIIYISNVYIVACVLDSHVGISLHGKINRATRGW